MTISQNVRVRMRDGVELAAQITRPDAEGTFPVVMAYTPYRLLTKFKAAPSERQYVNLFHASHYLAERGYISVNYDVRGTGASGGSAAQMYSDAERQDGYDMVEWIATQPWSNGNVGMWGLSYGGVVAWQVAALAPPHLKAIIVRGGTEDDCYRDWAYPGGVLRSFCMFGEYWPMLAAWNFAPPDPQSTCEKWAEIWKEHLENNVPWSIADLQHQTNDGYWRARSVTDFGRIKAAVFLIEGWHDWYPSAVLRAFAKLTGPKRVLIGPWGHQWPEEGIPGPRIDARPEYLRWFDQFLKGIDTGVLDEPPLTIYVRKYQAPAPLIRDEPGVWRRENEWPLARTRYTSMYLAARGRLELHPEADGPPERDSYAYRASVGAMSGILAVTQPQDQRWDEAHSLTYTTGPLESDLEVTGDPTAELFVSSSAEVAYFHVRVCDVAGDGTSKLVSDGGLNATHRTSHSDPEPLKSGETYHLRIDLKSIAYVFPAGHRIRVAISSADFQNAWPVSLPAVNSVIRGANFRSRVILPVAPPQMPLLPAVEFRPSPNPMPDSIPRPDYTITYDLINQTTTLNKERVSAEFGDSRATYTVSDINPGDAVVKGTYRYVIVRPDGEISVHAQAITASDAKVFRHIVEVEVTVDGRRHFSKSWTMSVPRVLS